MARSTCNIKRSKIYWIVFPQSQAAEYLEPWKRTVGLDPKNRIFVTAALADAQEAVAAMAAQESVETMENTGHLYVPDAWLATAYPEARAACRAITKAVSFYIPVNIHEEQ